MIKNIVDWFRKHIKRLSTFAVGWVTVTLLYIILDYLINLL